jgi:hypothetical protein
VFLVEDVTIPVEVVTSLEEGASCDVAGELVIIVRITSDAIHVNCW